MNEDLVTWLRACAIEGCGRTGKLTRGMCGKHYRYWLDHTPLSERGAAPRFNRDFWDFVNKSHEQGCWKWCGPTNRAGYGCWGKQLAHRRSWEVAHGPITDGLWVLHHCDNPPCVNPSHLYLGTVVENVRDAIDRGLWPQPPDRIQCALGHELAGANLIVVRSPTGRPWKRCRVCDNERKRLSARRSRAKRKAVAA